MEKKMIYTYNGHEYDPETKHLKYFRKVIPMYCSGYTNAEIRKLKNNLNTAIDWLRGLQQAEIRFLDGEANLDECVKLERAQLNELIKSIVYALGGEDILKDKNE